MFDTPPPWLARRDDAPVYRMDFSRFTLDFVSGTSLGKIHLGSVIGCRFARTGDHQYPDGIEHRTLEELVKAAPSCENIPVTIGHPTTGFGVDEATKRNPPGRLRNVRVDGEHLAGDIVVSSYQLAEALATGPELSLGYQCFVRDGFQIDIKADHLAAGLPVGGGRCGGSCCINRGN